MNNLPKHVNHRFVLQDGFLEIIHFIASNKIAISVFNEPTQNKTNVGVTRENLREIRDRINAVLGE